MSYRLPKLHDFEVDLQGVEDTMVRERASEGGREGGKETRRVGGREGDKEGRRHGGLEG